MKIQEGNYLGYPKTMSTERTVITLLTDFGTRDHFVAAMKGVILSINPETTIIDITHEIAPQDVREASFTMRSCYKNFPAGTIFVTVVDPGVGSSRRAIVAESEGYYFIAPDNGVLSFVLQSAVVYEITNKDVLMPVVSNTFHGRDIFAPAAAHLSSVKRPADLGPQVTDPVITSGSIPQKTADGISGEVIHIDRFGNLITNLTPDLLPDFPIVELAGTRIDRVSRTYSEAEHNKLFLITGSAGFIEISVREASAASLLGISPGERIFARKHPDKCNTNG